MDTALAHFLTCREKDVKNNRSGLGMPVRRVPDVAGHHSLKGV